MGSTCSKQVESRIQRAQIIVADLTGSNPNVAQELGYARALQKPVILLAQQTRTLPFDVRHFRVLEYQLDPEGIKSLRDRLVRTLKEILGEIGGR